MKIKEKKELHLKTENELLKLINDQREALVGMRLENSQNKLKNTREFFFIRKKIAILMSIKKEKEMIENG